jgi:hypothetical protein
MARRRRRGRGQGSAASGHGGESAVGRAGLLAAVAGHDWLRTAKVKRETTINYRERGRIHGRVGGRGGGGLWDTDIRGHGRLLLGRAGGCTGMRGFGCWSTPRSSEGDSLGDVHAFELMCERVDMAGGDLLTWQTGAAEGRMGSNHADAAGDGTGRRFLLDGYLAPFVRGTFRPRKHPARRCLLGGPRTFFCILIKMSAINASRFLMK